MKSNQVLHSEGICVRDVGVVQLVGAGGDSHLDTRHSDNFTWWITFTCRWERRSAGPWILHHKYLLIAPFMICDMMFSVDDGDDGGGGGRWPPTPPSPVADKEAARLSVRAGRWQCSHLSLTLSALTFNICQFSYQTHHQEFLHITCLMSLQGR